jgi:PP-loop superfamily ATP-utilizing enzyme
VSAAPGADERLARAGAVLAERGIPGRVSVEGHESEIAAVQVPAAAWDRVAGEEGAGLADDLKRLGFRYVALDLEPGG